MILERLCHCQLDRHSGERVAFCTYMGSPLFRLYEKLPYLRMSQPGSWARDRAWTTSVLCDLHTI